MLKQCYDKYIRENGYTKDLAQLGLIDLLSGYQKKSSVEPFAINIFRPSCEKRGIYLGRCGER